MTRRALGQFIAQKREAAGKSQREVAEELGYQTSQFVSNVEQGKAPLPIDKIKAWARSIKADSREIFQMVDRVRSAEDREVFNASRAVSNEQS